MKNGLGIMAIVALTLTLAGGCSLYRNDRCWMNKEQYLIARDLFIQTGSFDIVEQELARYEWRRCKINEALYRLEKEFEILPEEIEEAPVN